MMTEVTASLVKALRERTGGAMMDCKRALEATDGNIDAAAEKMRMDGQAKADKKSGRIAADGVVALAANETAAAVVEINCETDFVAKGDEFCGFADSVARAALVSTPDDIDLLLKLMIDGETLEERRRNLVAKLGENISVRRFRCLRVTDGALAGYVHGTRIAAIVAMEAGDSELAKDLAMHVAASKPHYIDAESVPASVLETERRVIEAQIADQSAGKSAEIISRMIDGKLRKVLGEITLMEQPFIKNPDQTVGQLLRSKAAVVSDFVRFEVGEGLERKEEDFASEVMAQARASMS